MKKLSGRFGQAVRQLRERRGWSQEELAARAELNRSYLGEIERGAAMPSLATVAKLAGALEISLADLMSHCEAASPAILETAGRVAPTTRAPSSPALLPGGEG
jgi:XRE family transcriptional regulator, regulator of sulfur utilization